MYIFYALKLAVDKPKCQTEEEESKDYHHHSRYFNNLQFSIDSIALQRTGVQQCQEMNSFFSYCVPASNAHLQWKITCKICFSAFCSFFRCRHIKIRLKSERKIFLFVILLSSFRSDPATMVIFFWMRNGTTIQWIFFDSYLSSEMHVKQQQN